VELMRGADMSGDTPSYSSKGDGVGGFDDDWGDGPGGDGGGNSADRPFNPSEAPSGDGPGTWY